MAEKSRDAFRTISEVADWLADTGNIALDEMRRTFNCGVGMIAVVSGADFDTAIETLTACGETAWRIGSVEAGGGEVESETAGLEALDDVVDVVGVAGFDDQVDLGGIVERVEYRQKTLARNGEGSVNAVDSQLVDQDIGAVEAGLPVVAAPDFFAKVGFEPPGEGIAAFGAARVHADLFEIEQVIEQTDVPVGGTSRTDMSENTGL